ncbi:Uncharacterised protein [Legionella busanensis]|uniref:Uncharacterized protein n=1 Tax=Legionella busanensis TaxID=190655 RepID=A0A378JR10_9GAMM|nr:hypothetical protein [Legionella busanensis]STX52330.1 Uncharacterised protein [Legionella busanensis]
MSDYNNTSEMVKKGKNYLHEEGGRLLEQGAQEVKESGKDWWAYVESHPIQSMFFGVIGYFALKGMFKN